MERGSEFCLALRLRLSFARCVSETLIASYCKHCHLRLWQICLDGDQRQWFLPLGVRQICRLTVAECH